jgi:hypothetical protein
MHLNVRVLGLAFPRDYRGPLVVSQHVKGASVPDCGDGVFFLYLGKPRFGDLSAHSVLSKGLFFLER